MVVIQTFRFEAGHRLMNHPKKCANIHGHNYKVEVSLSGDVDAKYGMVVDFGIMKQKIQKWLDDNWDHTLILNSRDKDCIKFCSEMDFKCFNSIDLGEPTVENMAQYLMTICQKLFVEVDIEVIRVVVYETDDSCACYPL